MNLLSFIRSYTPDDTESSPLYEYSTEMIKKFPVAVVKFGLSWLLDSMFKLVRWLICVRNCFLVRILRLCSLNSCSVSTHSFKSSLTDSFKKPFTKSFAHIVDIKIDSLHVLTRSFRKSRTREFNESHRKSVNKSLIVENGNFNCAMKSLT